MDQVADWIQVLLNAGALLVGGLVWKMYFENLKATIANKDSVISVANQQVNLWRDKAGELEKRTPEVVEGVLERRISIREAEIVRLTDDHEQGTKELDRVKQEVALLNRTLQQTKGFREVLAMEQPDPDDADFPEYVAYSEAREDRVVEVEVLYLGLVGVDSGQLMITDPAYIGSEWVEEPFEHDRIYRDVENGKTIKWNEDFYRFDVPLEPYGRSPSDLIAAGRLVKVPAPEYESYNYSYNGACHATMSSAGHGELTYRGGQTGAGVVFASGWGDGFYPVYGEKHDGRIMRVYVNTGAEPAPLSTLSVVP